VECSVFINKLLILLMVFVTSLVLALPEDANQPIEIEAQSVVVDETTGFNEFSGDAEVRQGSLLLLAELIQVQTENEEVVTVLAKGSLEKPAKYIQSQENQARFVEATATLITYDVDEGMIFLVGNAHLIQGFDSFSGDTLDYDINNDKVIVKGSEDGTERVKFKIVL
jgi:lipopolysaccharide export system protein LptA